LVSFAQRRQGLIVKKGNPKKIKTISDLVRDDVQIVNRPLGTGTRQLFDNEISKSGISSSQLNGYQTEVYHHIDAGFDVVYGRVDSVPGSQAVSDTLGLDFIPLCWEWLGFLILREPFFEDRIQAFISLLLKKKFQMLAKSFNGYDISLSGQILYPYRFKQEENI
jgi:putative molybdopterin biosynthesis protein